MLRASFLRGSFLALVSLALLPCRAAAQGETGTIAGVVKDATGGVLPGVTVEAASPALIEKIRAVVTDGDGQYKIINLRTGTYSVTFGLPGFNTVRREGIDLSAGFTATVSSELRVGSVEETITVRGESPIVDVQNVSQQKTVSRDIMDSLPAAKTFGSYAVLIPGVTISSPDVGGAYGDLSISLAVHGSRNNDSQIMVDGMPARNGIGAGGGQYGQFFNNGMMQEISFETAGMSAELENAGVRSNIIPREGGNIFKGVLFGNFTNSSLNSSNVSDALRAGGLQSNSVDRLYDVNPSMGGRLQKDKLWFFLSFRQWGTRTTRTGTGAAFPNLTPGGNYYTPDLTQRAYDHSWHLSASNRFTWQASPRNKFAFFHEYQNHEYEFPTDSQGNAPETVSLYKEIPQYLSQVSWSAPVTSRLLFEAGGTLAANDYIKFPQPNVVPGISPITELSTNFTYRAAGGAAYGHNRSSNYNYRASASYVTGSHAFKGGVTMMHTWAWQEPKPNNPVTLSTRNGLPVSLTQWATPIGYYEKTKYNLGLYVQDRWTVKRTTLNLGVRSDFLNMFAEPQSFPEGPFVPAREFAGVYNMPNWQDISPRLGVSHDLFGNGKTAVKASLGRYVISAGVSTFTRLANPMSASVNSVSRTWNDLNGNFAPDCDLRSQLANAECGQMQNLNFGKTLPATRYAEDVSEGFGVRAYNWEGTASIQHELLRGLSVNAAYNRRWYGNFTVTDNLLLSASDYESYCITAPLDSRLPGGGGNQICGYYDVVPSKLGQSSNVIAQSAGFGEQQEVYDGIDVTASARLPRGVAFSGGITMGRTRTDNCFVAGDPSLSFTSGAPRTAAYCDVRPPMLPNLKFLGVYPLPLWGIQASATIQSTPGPEVTASYAATNAEIRSSLGRNLAAGANATVLLELIPPGTMYAERLNQVDFRVTKTFKLGNARLQGMVDVFNMLNASPFVRVQNRFGPAWQTPTQTLIGRLIKFGGQIDF